jgi:hypothetical protein
MSANATTTASMSLVQNQLTTTQNLLATVNSTITTQVLALQLGASSQSSSIAALQAFNSSTSVAIGSLTTRIAAVESLSGGGSTIVSSVNQLLLTNLSLQSQVASLTARVTAAESLAPLAAAPPTAIFTTLTGIRDATGTSGIATEVNNIVLTLMRETCKGIGLPLLLLSPPLQKQIRAEELFGSQQ